jgi:hypothetical protein
MPCSVLDILQYLIETMKMETTGSCEILLYIHQTMQLHEFMYTYVSLRHQTAAMDPEYETSHLT